MDAPRATGTHNGCGTKYSVPEGYCTRTHVSELPQGLKVKGDLLLMGCENIWYLPKDLRVEGTVYLSGTKVPKLTLSQWKNQGITAADFDYEED